MSFSLIRSRNGNLKTRTSFSLPPIQRIRKLTDWKKKSSHVAAAHPLVAIVITYADYYYSNINIANARKLKQALEVPYVGRWVWCVVVVSKKYTI